MSVWRQGDGPHPMSAQASARRQQILEAAIAAMARKGFHETSIADIASLARVSRATVYQYFGDKRDILSAIGGRVEEAILAAIDAWMALPSGATGDDVERNARRLTERLRAMIDARIEQVIAALSLHSDAARLVLRVVRGKDGLDDVMRRIDAHVVRMLAADIRTAIDRGWARSCDAEMTARYLLGGIEKMLMDALDPEQPIPLDMARVVPEIGALVFFGLAHSDLLSETRDRPRRTSRPTGPGSRHRGRPASRREEGAM
jgi:AcrR family transcriptional regulator